METKANERSKAGLIGRFLGVGAANTVFTFLLYQLALLVVSYPVAYTISFVAGVVFAMVFQARAVFGVSLTVAAALRFVGFYLVSYGVGLLVLSLAVEWLGIPSQLAPFIVVAVMLPINFLGAQLIFGSRPS